MKNEDEIRQEINYRFNQIRKAKSIDEIIIACTWFNAMNWVLEGNNNEDTND